MKTVTKYLVQVVSDAPPAERQRDDWQRRVGLILEVLVRDECPGSRVIVHRDELPESESVR